MSETTTAETVIGRADKEALERDVKIFLEKELLDKALRTVPDIMMILNDHRQVIYANRALYDALGFDSSHAVCGLRPGEIVECVNSAIVPDGCGASRFCRQCGAAQAIQSALEGNGSDKECRVVTKDNNALDFRVISLPLLEQGSRYVILALKDISDEKRRRALERIFFHDILNTAGGIQGLTELLTEADDTETDRLIRHIQNASRILIEEIQAQRQLIYAETGQLQPTPTRTTTIDVLRDILAIYREHEVARGKKLVIAPSFANAAILVDATLLKRVLGNLIKNAIEAIETGERVTVCCEIYPDKTVRFAVHNPGVIPEDIQTQIFQRSFSTKGDDRGLGAYSVKLLGERYLKGKAWFETSKDAGTIFHFALPPECLLG